MVVNPMDYSGKDTVLDVLHAERENFYKVIDDPANWNVQTRCTEWEVRDIVGHQINITEEIFLAGWDRARKGEAAVTALGAHRVADRLNAKAKEFRSLPRDEAIIRCKAGSDKVLAIFDALTADEWSGFMVEHLYARALPAYVYPMLLLGEYGIHTWDMRWGLGAKDARLDQRTGGILTPLALMLRSLTIDSEAAEGVNVVYGIQVDGEWGGCWKAKVKDGKFESEVTRDIGDALALFHYKHPSDFVLSTWQRADLSEATGDPEVIQTVRGLFLSI
jgi:uncharacterized protein (TIGR03083 family)